MSSLSHLRVIERAFAQAEREVAAEIQKAVRRGSKNTEASLRSRQGRIRRVLSTLMDFVVGGASEADGPLRRMVEETFGEGSAASEADLRDKGVPVEPRLGQALPRSVGVLLARLAGDLADAVDFVGRRSDDVLREVVLEQAAVGEIAGSTRAKTARKIEEELKERGVKAFRDKAGREWSLSAYARMAANATRSEATTAATLDRLAENGIDLAQVSDHNAECEICGPFEGRVFSITGTDTEFPPLIDAPPFHPFCRHVLTAFIRGLSSLGGAGGGRGSGGGPGGPGGSFAGGGGEEPLSPDDPGGPNHEWFRRGTMADSKFDPFLFNPDHEQNRGKAQGWRHVFGIGTGDGELLKGLIREQLDQAEIVLRDEVLIGNDFVRQYELVIPRFRGPNGNVAPVVTAWAQDPGEEVPHLVTTFPRTS